MFDWSIDLFVRDAKNVPWDTNSSQSVHENGQMGLKKNRLKGAATRVQLLPAHVHVAVRSSKVSVGLPR